MYTLDEYLSNPSPYEYFNRAGSFTSQDCRCWKKAVPESEGLSKAQPRFLTPFPRRTTREG